MSRTIKKAIFIFIIIFVVFTCSVLISEAINNRQIISSYPDKADSVIPGIVSIAKPTAEAFEFQKSKVMTWLIRLFLSFAVPAFFLFSKLSVSIRNWASKKTKRWVSVIMLYFLVYSVIEMLIYLPLDMYTGFLRMHHYGLSNQNFSQWFTEFIKNFIVNSLIGAVIIWIPFYIIKRFQKFCWLLVGIAVIPYLFFMAYIQPIAIDPVFNQYKELESSDLSHKIDELLNKTYIENCQVYQVDKSKETNLMNAYMTGVLNTKRIVLWDTTIDYLNTEEVLGIVAHEVGHYLMGHVWKSIVLGGMGGIVVLYFAHCMCVRILRKAKGTLGFTKLSDIAAFPLIIITLNIVLFIATPLSNFYSRGIELDADKFELELTQNNYATATGTIKLHQQSLTMPEPGFIYMLWTYDHPTFKSRVDFANNYKPWTEGQQLKFQKYIK